jgi:hypothetical protein
MYRIHKVADANMEIVLLRTKHVIASLGDYSSEPKAHSY